MLYDLEISSNMIGNCSMCQKIRLCEIWIYCANCQVIGGMYCWVRVLELAEEKKGSPPLEGKDLQKNSFFFLVNQE